MQNNTSQLEFSTMYRSLSALNQKYIQAIIAALRFTQLQQVNTEHEIGTGRVNKNTQHAS